MGFFRDKRQDKHDSTEQRIEPALGPVSKVAHARPTEPFWPMPPNASQGAPGMPHGPAPQAWAQPQHPGSGYAGPVYHTAPYAPRAVPVAVYPPAQSYPYPAHPGAAPPPAYPTSDRSAPANTEPPRSPPPAAPLPAAQPAASQPAAQSEQPTETDAAARPHPPASSGGAPAQPGSQSPASPPPEKRRRWRSALITRLAAACLVVATAWFGAMMLYYTVKFPDPMAAQDEKAPTIRILARDGSLITQRGEKHPYMPIDLIPRHVLDAVVAIEDRRFYDHGGVDFQGLVRAALTNLRAGRYAQGGSTLTQQLAKNMYLSPKRTLMRKLEELSLAVWLELRLSKDEILELYLNQVYFGSGAYGIEAAAQRHFGKSASALTVVEGAIIAGLLKAPSRYSPSNDPAAARKRGRIVLRSMHDAGFLTLSELNGALARPVRFKRRQTAAKADDTGYAVDFILERMPSILSAEEGGIIVETSLDLDLQRLAQKTLAETLRKNKKTRNVSQGALIIMDENGGIRAIAGGADFNESQFNRAVRAERQPGSTFKPFVFLTALENGMTPESITYDLPLSVRGWSPRNANNAYRGEVTLREALSKSINTVAVRLALDYGPSRVVEVARRAGIGSKLRKDPSLALGTSEVTLMELTGAYVPFANGGRPIEPHIIQRVRNVSGRILYANSASPADAAFQLRNIGAMNDMLNAAMIAGTGRKAALADHPAAGKTGTSQDFRDAWFVGYTAHLVAGIWLGNDDGKPMKKVTGGSLPAKIWHRVMGEAHAQLTPLPLPGTFRPGTRISPGFVARREGAPAAKARGRKAGVAASRRGGAKLAGQRIKIEPPSTLAPTEAPPLPARTARKIKRPKDRISADFIARALGETAPGQPAYGPSLAGSGQSGFDTEEIRRRLARARKGPATGRPPGNGPYMALGAKPANRSLPPPVRP